MELPKGFKNATLNTGPHIRGYLKKLVPNWDDTRIYVTGKWDIGGSKLIMVNEDGTLLIIKAPYDREDAYNQANRLIGYFDHKGYDMSYYVTVYGEKAPEYDGIWAFDTVDDFNSFTSKVRQQYPNVGFKVQDRPDNLNLIVNK